MRPFFPFYGGKWRAAKLYPPPIAGRPVIEPFAGSAGYSVYHGVPRAVLVDRDPAVVGVWRYLIGASVADIEALPDIMPGQAVGELAVCEEARWLIGFWINPGSEAPRLTPSKWMRDHLAGVKFPSGPCNPMFWGERVRRRLAAQVPLIRRWKIIEGDYSAAPDVLGTWFVDPPYDSPAGRRYRHHEVDRRALAKWSRARRGSRIVCESAGATWLPFKPLATVRTAGTGRLRSGTLAEVVWRAA